MAGIVVVAGGGHCGNVDGVTDGLAKTTAIQRHWILLEKRHYMRDGLVPSARLD
jgi:hypothetical protein